MTAPALDAALRARACAESAVWRAVLQIHDERVAELDRDDTLTGMYRQLAVKAISRDLARQMLLSEQQVWRIVHTAEALRSDAPAVWSAFCDGVIDEQRAFIVSHALERCRHDATRARLDAMAVDYAATHTPTELRRRLDRLIDRLEPPDLDQADRELKNRSVTFDHAVGAAMSELRAWIPSSTAAAIEARLTEAARELVDDPECPRTVKQREADLLCAWLLNAEGTECDIRAEIAVLVEATALAGRTDTPGQLLTPQGPVPVPADWVLRLAESGHALWTRLVTDPRGEVLDMTHLGYQPPRAMRDAIRWRDLTCRASGCLRPAERCDLDHVKPYDAGGATTAANLRSLCRRHHAMKGHGLLGDDAYDPPEQHLVRLPAPDVVVEYIA